MGFLTIKSNTLPYDEAKEMQDQIKYYGVLQAIKLYDTFKDIHIQIDDLKWGEEIEYNVGTLSSEESNAKIVVEGFQKVQEALSEIKQDDFVYQAEFGSWMVEAVPNKPYTLSDTNSPIKAFDSLIKRRKLVNDAISKQKMFINTLSSWPNLGCKDFFQTDQKELYRIEDYEEYNTASRSDYVLDDITNPHPRFPTMMSYVRHRRGKKVDIRVPLYKDVYTGVGKIDGRITPDEIHMDSQHFGMGCNCLQITFETQNIEHAKYLHDSFIPLAPIFGALSASAPIFKGQLSNRDFRWNVIGDSVDSRTDEEKDPNNSNHMPKSRYSGMNHFLSDHPYFSGDKLNDGVKLKVNEEWLAKLKDTGMSDRLAYHFVSLFNHDALVIYKDRTGYEEDSTEHFEGLNSTNWNSVRFKPPPSLDSSIGWRVEFRTLDIQITDFENAAYVAIVNLMTRVLNEFDINVSLPISK